MIEEILIKAAQLMLSLSLLVFVHELGHFMFARLFKVRVNKFYLFFNWKYSIVKFKKIKGKWRVKFFAENQPEHVQPLKDKEGNVVYHEMSRWDELADAVRRVFGKKALGPQPVMVQGPLDVLDDDDWRKYPESTEWGIGWLPLGGYCNIAGMVDESKEVAALMGEPQAWEYRSKSTWQRLLIIIGGVLMNFVTAIVVYSMMLYAWGREVLPVSNAYLGYDYCTTALNNGFENGDVVLSVDGEAVQTEKDVVEKIVIEGGTEVMVKRGQRDTLLVLPHDFGEQMLAAEERQFMAVRVPFVVDSVVSANTVLQRGDSVVEIAGCAVSSYSDVMKVLEANKDSEVEVKFMRKAELCSATVVVDAMGKLGLVLRNPYTYFTFQKQEYGFWSSIPAGWNLCVSTLESYVKQFRLVFTKEGAKSLGGFAAIGNLFPGSWDWSLFWNMTAFLSVVLAFMNVLPIPVLDGGYVLFILYEMITRRKPSERFMEVSLNIGMLLLLALMIFANANDIIRIFR